MRDAWRWHLEIWVNHEIVFRLMLKGNINIHSDDWALIMIPNFHVYNLATKRSFVYRTIDLEFVMAKKD